MKIGICNSETKMVCNCWRRASRVEEIRYEVLGCEGFNEMFGLNLCDPKEDPHNEKSASECEYREEIEE